jgi:hypothetical protein
LNVSTAHTRSCIPVDYLIVTWAYKQTPELALAYYRPQQIILDASVSAYRALSWKAVAQEENLSLWDARERPFMSYEL